MRIFLVFLTVLIFLHAHAHAQSQTGMFDVGKLNSYADEQIPLLTDNGKSLFFTRAHHAENIGGKADKGDIWFAQLTDSIGWTVPGLLASPINTISYNGVFAYINSSLYLYSIYRNENSSVQGVSTSNPVKWPYLWQQPKSISIAYFSNESANNGNALSHDGKTMILSLESYKSYGAEDLYVSFWNWADNNWSEPKNLGVNINTALQELTPYLSPDNKTLFFSSNGRGGMGSRDIFVSQRIDDSWTKWTEPKNLGSKVNSEGAEMGYRYYPRLGVAVYTSTKDSDGYGDIHIIPVPAEELNQLLEEEIEVVAYVAKEEPTFAIEQPEIGANQLVISGKIMDARGNELIFANTKVKAINGLAQEHFNDTTFSFILPANSDYILQVEAEGYISKQIELILATNEAKEVIQNVRLEAIKVGAIVKLENVLFVKGTTKLLSSSYDELDLVAGMLLNNPSLIIELAGHTDSRGNATLNIQLSQKRVESVIDYLVEQGVGKDRLSGKGYGGAKPIAANTSEATRKLNRRVEFKIVKQ